MWKMNLKISCICTFKADSMTQHFFIVIFVWGGGRDIDTAKLQLSVIIDTTSSKLVDSVIDIAQQEFDVIDGLSCAINTAESDKIPLSEFYKLWKALIFFNGPIKPNPVRNLVVSVIDIARQEFDVTDWLSCAIDTAESVKIPLSKFYKKWKALIFFNPNPCGWGVSDFQNFEEVYLCNSLSSELQNPCIPQKTSHEYILLSTLEQKTAFLAIYRPKCEWNRLFLAISYSCEGIYDFYESLHHHPRAGHSPRQ